MKPFDLEKAKAGAPEDAVCVIKTNDGNKYFFSENDSKAFGIYLCFAGQLEISMHRQQRIGD